MDGGLRECMGEINDPYSSVFDFSTSNECMCVCNGKTCMEQ